MFPLINFLSTGYKFLIVHALFRTEPDSTLRSIFFNGHSWGKSVFTALISSFNFSLTHTWLSEIVFDFQHLKIWAPKTHTCTYIILRGTQSRLCLYRTQVHLLNIKAATDPSPPQGLQAHFQQSEEITCKCRHFGNKARNSWCPMTRSAMTVF